jgi:hypothetical protein
MTSMFMGYDCVARDLLDGERVVSFSASQVLAGEEKERIFRKFYIQSEKKACVAGSKRTVFHD